MLFTKSFRKADKDKLSLRAYVDRFDKVIWITKIKIH